MGNASFCRGPTTGVGMMNDSSSKRVRQAWERPALYKLDAADAQKTTAGKLNDSVANKS